MAKYSNLSDSNKCDKSNSFQLIAPTVSPRAMISTVQAVKDGQKRAIVIIGGVQLVVTGSFVYRVIRV